MKLPDGKVVQIRPPWAGTLSGFTLLFEAFRVPLCREMPFRAVSRPTDFSVHRLMALWERYDAAVIAVPSAFPGERSYGPKGGPL